MSIKGIRPQGDKEYFVSGSLEGDRTLASLSLVTFSLLKEIAIPVISRMIFFDRP